MESITFAFVTFLLAVHPASATPTPTVRCGKVLQAAGATDQFGNYVAHAIHSMTMDTLRKFEPKITEDNKVTNLNKLNSHHSQSMHQSNKPTSSAVFATDGMRVLDTLLSNMDSNIGGYETTLELAVHTFHMEEMWAQTHTVYQQLTTKPQPFDKTWLVCQCAMDTKNNGIIEAIDPSRERGHENAAADSGCQLRERILTWWEYRVPSVNSTGNEESACGTTAWLNFIKYLPPTAAANDAAIFLYCALNYDA